jgi:hypothetical protein
MNFFTRSMRHKSRQFTIIGFQIFSFATHTLFVKNCTVHPNIWFIEDERRQSKFNGQITKHK